MFSGATAHSGLPKTALSILTFVCTGPQSVLKIVPIFLLLLLEFLLVAHLLVVGLCPILLRWSKRWLCGRRRHHILPLRPFLLFFSWLIDGGTLRNYLLLGNLRLLLRLRGLLLGWWLQHTLRRLLLEDLWGWLLNRLLITNSPNVGINLRIVGL